MTGTQNLAEKYQLSIANLIECMLDPEPELSRPLVDTLISGVKAIQDEMAAIKLTGKGASYPRKFFQAPDLKKSQASMHSLPFQSDQPCSESNLQDSFYHN